MTDHQLIEAYFKRLVYISQQHTELQRKDAGDLFMIACDMEAGKYKKNHKLFKWINNASN